MNTDSSGYLRAATPLGDWWAAGTSRDSSSGEVLRPKRLAGLHGANISHSENRSTKQDRDSTVIDRHTACEMRRLRELADLTQEELADYALVSVQSIGAWERGEVPLRQARTVLALLKLTGRVQK